MLSPEYERLLSPFILTVACAPVVVEPDGPAVTPSRVIGQTGLETRLEASERSGFTPYVGREAHLARLERDVDSAHRGNGRVIEIVGDAGVGKSRLVYELRERLSATGATALQGRCRAFGDVAPYCPFIEIVRGALQLEPHGIVDSPEVVAKFRAIDVSLEPSLRSGHCRNVHGLTPDVETRARSAGL